VTAIDRDAGRIHENARSDQPFRALLADSDLATLGTAGARHQVLGLLVELQRDRLEATLRDANPDLGTGVAFLDWQIDLHRNHRYLLADS
jgi:hypothetical protein